MSRRVLILFAHPAFHRSRAQRALVRAAQRVVASARPAHGRNRDLFPRDELATP